MRIALKANAYIRSMKWLTLFNLILFPLLIVSQDFPGLESMMVPLQHIIGNGDTDEERVAASASFRSKLIDILDAPGGTDYPFNNLAKLGKVSSPDGAFRLLGWNVPMNNGTYSYYVFVVFPEGKGYVELLDNATLTHDDELRSYSAEEWYGALYYAIQPVQWKNDKYYVLLGWDGNSKTSNKKVIETMQIQKKGRITFGKQVFGSEKGVRYRRVFEYAKDVQMTLKYLPEKEAFIFDEMQPRLGYAVGNYAYYGPGTTHNAYRLVKGVWELELNTDMSRPKSEEGKSQFNFPDRPDLNKIRNPSGTPDGK